jgi:SAM-dependent MidA family methyltransferase
MTQLQDRGLPAPDAVALAHSDAVRRHVVAALDAAGGWLDFADYLDVVLYAPGLGYYSAGATRFGAAGDFVTAPELGSALAGCLARVVRRLQADLPAATVLEFGAGSGALAADLLAALAESPPARYLIVEVSADLRERQQHTLAARVPQLLSRVQWLDRLPTAPVDGLVVANEIVDAIPFSCFRSAGGKLLALGVRAGTGSLEWEARPAGDALRAAIEAALPGGGQGLPDGYTGEVRPRADAWVATVAGCLGEGLALLVDYGGTAREIYHPDRRGGTLLCHYRHRAHDDPFLWPGLQDVTSWVDFSRLSGAARAAGLQVAAYGTQAHFLLANGVLDEAAAQCDGLARARWSREVGALLLPGGLGERFKVLALAHRVPAWSRGLVMRDLGGAL